MNVSLTPELERYVQEKVSTGRYHSSSEVLREALRLQQDHDRLRAMKLDALRREITIGFEQAEQGELVDGEHFFDALQRRVGQGMES